MENKRVYLWDNLKFFLITLVVVGHFISYYFEFDSFKEIYIFIYSFHMPLFFFISGMFHQNKNVAQKVYCYFSIGMLIKILNFAVLVVLGREKNIDFFSGSGVSWFVFALAGFILSSYLLRDVNPKLLLIISVILACFIGYDKKLDDFSIIFRIFNFYPYYMLGIVLDREKIQKVLHRKETIMIGWGILITWLMICVVNTNAVFTFRPLFFGHQSYGKYGFSFLYRLASYLLAGIVGGACICVMPNRKIPLVTEFGKRTLQVYFWHRAILYAFAELNVFGDICSSVVGKVIYLLVAIALTFVLSMKFFSFPTEFIVKYSRRRQ